MKYIYAIFQKEVSAFFNSLIGYVVMAVFLTGIGLFFWVFEGSVLETGVANMDILFDLAPYMLLFLVPAITMRAFSEEVKSGTIEFLLTKPITAGQLILGKYGASVFLVFFAILPTLIYYLCMSFIAKPAWSLDTGAIIGAYIGLLALGAIFAAVGLFTSSLTDNQIVAFILGVFICFVGYLGFDLIAGLKLFNAVNGVILKIGVIEHYRSISRGVIDTRDILYFFSVVTILLILTYLSLNARKQ